MPSLRLLNGKFYGRIRHNGKEFCIGLKTTSELLAKQRLDIVEKYEEEIIEFGKSNIIFPWESGSDGKTKLRTFSLGEAIDQYLEYRKRDQVNPLRATSLYQIGMILNRFAKEFGRSYNIGLISQKHINDLKNKYTSTLARETTDSYFRGFNTFWNWAKKYYKIQELKIGGIKLDYRPPVYLSEEEFDRIINVVDDEMRRIFIFYIRTGCRLREPFIGKLSENGYLIIDSSYSKNHRPREIILTEEDVEVVKHLKKHFRLVDEKDRHRKRYIYLSDHFRYACDKIGLEGKKFHSLRHSFAIRLFLMTNNIFYVQKRLGHANIKMTLKYSEFSFQRLAKDFPSIIKDPKNDFRFKNTLSDNNSILTVQKY